MSGDVIGFILQGVDGEDDNDDDAIYFSGDSVWYQGVAEVSRRFKVTTAVLCLGAATLPEIGPVHLTMNASDAVATARAFPQATIVPVHFDGWAHFSEGKEFLTRAFEDAGVASRVLWLEAGKPTPR
jgi:L-ascorbate metabolism protein UlaG (beta-lactamase superfamily)